MYAEEWDNEPIETRYALILTREQYMHLMLLSNLWPYIQSVLLLFCLSLFIIVPSMQDISPYERTVPLYIVPKMFSTTVAIVPTGADIVPATFAHGWITVYNGSILAQRLPAGFIVESASGVEITLDDEVMVPAGNPPNYGIATVQAHAVVAGQAGNIPAFAINEADGTSLTLRNRTAFSGGADSYTVPIATDGDKQKALDSARRELDTHTYGQWLDKPCSEQESVQAFTMTVLRSCLFVRYTIPAGMHVLSVQRVGNTVILEVRR